MIWSARDVRRERMAERPRQIVKQRGNEMSKEKKNQTFYLILTVLLLYVVLTGCSLNGVL